MTIVNHLMILISFALLLLCMLAPLRECAAAQEHPSRSSPVKKTVADQDMAENTQDLCCPSLCTHRSPCHTRCYLVKKLQVSECRKDDAAVISETCSFSFFLY